jgi:hypothetical protein
MKKVILLFAVCCFITLSITEAQITPGKIMIGVSSKFNFLNYGTELAGVGLSIVKSKSNAAGYVEPEPDKSTSINLAPKAGFFLNSNLVIGLDGCLTYSSTKDGVSKDSYTSTLYGVGPFVRYYIPTSMVMPFLEVNGLYGGVKAKYVSTSYTSDFTSGWLSVGGGAGVAILLGDKVTFDLMAGYNYFREMEKENNPDKERTVTGSLGLQFGFIVLLGGQ